MAIPRPDGGPTRMEDPIALARKAAKKLKPATTVKPTYKVITGMQMRRGGFWTPPTGTRPLPTWETPPLPKWEPTPIVPNALVPNAIMPIELQKLLGKW